ncbi:type I pullulanase [Anaerobacillus alkaliphilus]|uniref:Type I pullulanase n=1 Tax=Anaerobacillus alkaliphilus TaxID=1548597 RepID=A0A4Q0VQV4_9BACI|nr:type I pullulanase [Anaerobacillus alkaliphilus]RXI98628.1 type I pullulanase [Anaerobacillus alkaliphilus]
MAKHAYIDELRLITIPFAEVEEELSNFKLINMLSQEEVHITNWEKKPERLRYEIYLQDEIELGVEYKLIVNMHLEYETKIGQVVRTIPFDDRFYYDGELGVSTSSEGTTFKLWAPTATKVVLVFYNYEEDGEQIFSPSRNNKGVWEHTTPQNLDGTIYMYRVKVDGVWREAVDPYAKAVTVNGEKGVVVNLTSTNPNGWLEFNKPEFLHPTDALIYELHIRDFSSCESSGITYRGKFKGLIEKGTKGPCGTITGFDYLIDLGVTHVQLLPVQDFGSVDETRQFDKYNWGYDTIHYNALEGSYSLYPNCPKARITELKEVVQQFHQNGLRVVLDVIYNHVYIHEESNFEKIVPGYYFRYNLDGSLANGTGVGNDLASERKMVRRFIVDSVTYLAKEFHVDGFRFDLMGILDIETMRKIKQTLDEIDPTILVIGEGWDLATPLASEEKAIIANSDHLPGIGHFNDQFRDKLKGSIFHQETKGFSNGNGGLKEDFKMLVSGSTKDFYHVPGLFSDPYKSVNYVECHDNHTLWDKLILANPHDDEQTRKLMHRLATTITILSQGIPFLHAGQEFFRTKRNVENSYNSPDDINRLDWKRKALNIDNVDYIKGLIALRSQNSVFRFVKREDVKKHMYILDTPSYVLAYLLKKEDGIFVVAHNSAKESKEVILPSSGRWEVFVEEITASPTPFRYFEGAKITIQSLTTTVLYHRK